MITTPTTFVIGAGANPTDTLPVGHGLLDKAAKLDRHKELRTSILQAIGNDTQRLNSFLDDLRQHPARSIDAFLETRPDQATRDLGHVVIAALMGQALIDHPTPRFKVDEDWIGHVIRWMISGARTAREFADGNSHVRFVTFNFDSVLESEIARLVHGAYRGQPEVDKAVETIWTYHVHGKLPEPVRQVGSLMNPGHFVDPVWIDQAAKHVRVVHDELDADERIRARQAVSSARVLCFLGFGYHLENLKSLDVKALVARPQGHQEIFGSGMNLSGQDKAIIRRAFELRIELGGQDQNCLKFLESHDVLRVT